VTRSFPALRVRSGALLATTDDLGQVSLFRNPCVRLSGDPHVPRAPNRKSFAAHASAALDCCWASGGGDELVLSAGGFDLALMQWQARKEAPSPEQLQQQILSSLEVAPPTPAEQRAARRQRKALARQASQSSSPE
jgi:hypothetical protein